MKTISDKKPLVIQPLGNGAYYYNYNIVEKSETTETGETHVFYECDTVKIWNEPTYEKVVKAVIREDLDETQEFCIINEYNAGVLGVITDATKKAEAKATYKEYLAKVVAIKEMVKKDLNA